MKLLAALFMAFSIGHVGVAANEQPNKLVAGTKAVVDYLEPTPELGVFVSFKNIGAKNLSQFEGFSGISGSLYKFTSQDIELGSIRLGGVFEGERKLYSTIGIEAVGIAKRYFSDSLKETLSPGVMGNVWDVMDKYGSVAVGVGLDDVEQLAGGFDIGENAGLIGTMGVKIRF